MRSQPPWTFKLPRLFIGLLYTGAYFAFELLFDLNDDDDDDDADDDDDDDDDGDGAFLGVDIVF